MLTLYRFPGATCAAKVLMALDEKNVPFDDRVIAREDLSSSWYRDLNPNGVVPTIVHDGETIVESSVILQYIDDAFDGAPLRPARPLGRARMNHWLKLLDDSLNSLGTVTYALFSRHGFLEKTPREREDYYAAIPDPYLRASRRNAIELGVEAPEFQQSFAALTALQHRADAATHDQEYLTGAFSLADISLAPFISRLEMLGLLASETALPSFHRWWKTIQARPSFERAVLASMPAAAAGRMRALAAAHAGRLAELASLHDVPAAVTPSAGP